MIALLFAVSTTAVEPTLQGVLARAAAYVATFEEQLSALAGEETYVQEVTGYNKRGCPQSTSAGTYQATMNCGSGLVQPMRSELHSHLLLVRNRRSGYLQYRDVYEVDGRMVGDREERFTRIFADASAPADEQMRTILAESARFNIGDVYREMNVPLLALQFLSSQHQWRFSFKRAKDTAARVGNAGEPPPGTFRVSTDVWVLEYEEKEPRTIIRTIDGKSIKSRGRIWIEPDGGRITMTELVTRGRGVDASVSVSFKSEPVRGLLVPVEMRERYRTRQGSAIDAVARYGRFAPFEKR